MKLRQISILLAIGILVAGFFGKKWLEAQKKPPRQINAQLVQAVGVQEVRNDSVKLSVPVTGKLAAQQRLDLFAEVSGILKPVGKPFKEGTAFSAGELLLNLDDREARNNLLAQKSQLLNSVTQLLPDLQLDYKDSYQPWKAWLDGFDLQKPVPELPEMNTEQERYFISARNIPNLYYSIKSAEVRLSKYRVTAPFNGVLANAMIDQGALVRAGQKMGEFIRPGSFEVEAAISLQQSDLVSVGDEVALTSSDIAGQWTGTVARISDQLDPATQSVKIYINVAGDRLREGMYLEGNVTSETVPNALSVPRGLLHNNNELFVVEADTLLAVQPVSVLQFIGDQAIVRGLQDGQQLVTTNVAGAYKGMVVVIR